MTVNPLYIYTYKQSNKLKDNNIIQIIKDKFNSEFNCPICFESLSSKKMCVPFNCKHPICFTCFTRICRTYKFTDKVQRVKCPLCRQKCSRDWIIKPTVKTNFLGHEGKEIEIVIPS